MELLGSAMVVEKAARTLLVGKFSGIVGLPHVLTHRVYVDGEADARRILGYQHPVTQKLEYRLLVIDFRDIQESQAGCDDNPVYYLLYTLKLTVMHMDQRSDGSTSTDDYARIYLTLRQRILDARHLGDYSNLRCENLTPEGPTQFGVDNDTLVYGHHGTLLLKVEVTPA